MSNTCWSSANPTLCAKHAVLIQQVLTPILVLLTAVPSCLFITVDTSSDEEEEEVLSPLPFHEAIAAEAKRRKRKVPRKEGNVTPPETFMILFDISSLVVINLIVQRNFP